MTKILTHIGSAAATIAAAVYLNTFSAPPAAARDADPEYMTAPFRTERVLDWGTRPDWSPDGVRVAFTESEFNDSHAYELDLATRRVRCLTCQFGMNGLVTRIYYLPDGSFLLLAPRNLAGPQMGARTSLKSNSIDEELYLMPASAAAPPQPLGANAFGEIAISRSILSGGVRIAWGEIGKAKQLLNIATLTNNGKTASLSNARALYDSTRADRKVPITATETYGFAHGDKSVYFWTIVPGATLDGEMYEIDIASGALRPMYRAPSHNETHLFSDERYGLEESNRISDPTGEWRGVSAIDGAVVAMMAKASGLQEPTRDAIEDYAPLGDLKGFNRPFDIFVIALDGSRPPRQLTDFSQLGANAGQSAPAPDGRRIVYAVDERSSGKAAGAGGIYIGEFTK